MHQTLPASNLLDLMGKVENEAGQGPPVCVAVVNASGKLAAFWGMDGTPDRVVTIAQNKAYTAMRMGTSTKAFRERLQREQLAASDFCDTSLTPLEGGIPLMGVNGRCIGGLGVSGRKTSDDHDLAVRLTDILQRALAD
ncbi:MAG: hypothetical protein BCS36_12125 [Desulfovibrio sp. MES5]|uniref:GlcG/HbpS family heme-binding protein n=1 Tax=Desulfovibrio sp. MES5 TaxID=1899016 RepID=UPI000B9CC782|nr:heme-binding protein [Desulfovibrio sp. MES5]OXS29161.1 MAG: hypothetical protein BCS36_12125 [Desulfovibrio sp. MES5]